jgi:hypothetical protein
MWLVMRNKIMLSFVITSLLYLSVLAIETMEIGILVSLKTASRDEIVSKLGLAANKASNRFAE